MIHTELHAAGIDDSRLAESYRYCRRLNAQHGRTYFLATRLLAPSQRPPVHALYGSRGTPTTSSTIWTPTQHRRS